MHDGLGWRSQLRNWFSVVIAPEIQEVHLHHPRSLALQGPTWSCFIGFSKSNHIRACAITTFGPTHANWPLVIFKIAGCPSTAQHHHQTQNLICARNSQFLAFKCYLNELKFPFSFSNRATSRWISLYFLFSNPNVTCFA